MPKNIILLSDGTGNSASKLFKTNVWRLYQALDLRPPHLRPLNPEKSNSTEQVAYYDDGVGTASFKPLAILGGAFGWGTKRIVLDIYSFLCRHYEVGDQIYAFGFSRGAFAIRMLVGLIVSQGIVQMRRAPDPQKKDEINPAFLTERELRRLAAEAFRRYREESYGKNKLIKFFRSIRNRLLRIMYKGTRRKPYKKEKNIKAKSKGGPVEINFLGLWDTVAAYGLPFDELTKAWDLIFPLAFPNRKLSPTVKSAYHALALDDERLTFHPEVWDEEGDSAQEKEERPRINQVWFAGMHSNVGGGYPDDALSGVPLNWMVDEAEQAGLVFLDDERRRMRESASPLGRQYDSRGGVGGLYRYMPRNVKLLMRGEDHHDHVPKIHHSVIERISRRTSGYAPIGLPSQYEVVGPDGSILTPDDPLQIETPDQARGRSFRQERIWNLVWWKRVVYFATVYIFIVLAAFPIYSKSEQPPDNPLLFVSKIIGAAGAFLPGFLDRWLKSFQGNPGLFLVIALAFVVTLFISSLMQSRIFDRMRGLWVVPLPQKEDEKTEQPGGIAYWFRREETNLGVIKFLKEKLLPYALIVVMVAWLLLRGVFQLIDVAGFNGGPTKNPQAVGDFDTRSLCWDSGKDLQEGEYYKLTLMPTEEWLDNGKYPGLPNGVDEESRTMGALRILRRQLGQPYYKLIARIGQYGRDDYPLELKHLDGSNIYTAEFTAPKSGKLFLYVNDGVLPWFASGQKAYQNNQGKAAVSVERWESAGVWLPVKERQ